MELKNTIEEKYEMVMSNPEIEYWTNAVGFPGYKVSSLGKVITLKNQISKCSPRKDGYIEISMKNDEGKASMRRLHQVVAASFIPNKDNKKEVNHINGVRHDCKMSNLEWVDRTENCRKILNRSSKDSSRKIIQLSEKGEEVKIWNSVKEILETKIINKANLRSCCAGKMKKSNGFIWKYYDEHIILENEIWKEIEHKNKKVNVSTHGRIKYKDGRKTYGSCTKTEKSYMIWKSNRIHRLVMIAHKPCEDMDKLVVDHIDGDTKNNKIENLRWATHSENAKYSYDKGRKKVKTREKKILQYDIEDKFIKEFNSISEAGKKLNINSDAISNCAKGKTKIFGGYVWKYKKEKKHNINEI